MRAKWFLALALVSITAAAVEKPAVDFARLDELCNQHWLKFLDEIPNVQKAAHEWLGDLDTRKVQTLYDADDQLIIFTSNFFPSELEGRFTGPESFDDCRGLNVGLQREMADRSVPHGKQVEAYAQCVSSRYGNGDPRKLIKPLDKIAKCYLAQSRVYRP